MSLTDVTTGITDVIAAFGRTITIRSRAVGARNTTTLATAVTNTDRNVSALRYDARTTSFGETASAANAVQYEYRFLKASLDSGNTAPDGNDVIIDGTLTLQITSVDTSADSLAWIVQTQGKK